MGWMPATASLAFPSKSRVCNSSNENLSELCDIYAHALLIYLPLFWKLQKLPRHKPYYAMCMRQNFWVNQGYVSLAKKIWSELCDLYAHAQPILLVCCKFLIITLKTVGGVAETQILLCHVYNAIFQSKSKVCNSSNKSSAKWSIIYGK